MKMVKKNINIEYKTINDVLKLKKIILENFSIFNTDITFKRCAFLFTKDIKSLEIIIFGLLNSAMMDYKINKLDFIEATINKETRDGDGNFLFAEERKIDLHFVECFIGEPEEFKEKYQSVENLE